MSAKRDVEVGVRRVPGPSLTIARASVPAFWACGVAGLAAGCAVAFTVVAAQGLRPFVMAVLVIVSVATFLTFALLTKVLRGEERLVYYHHVLAVMATATAVLALMGAPLLGYLEATTLGVGAFLAWGRVGCLLAGCCHGRPWRTGVVYGERHVRGGFPAALAGVPLVPVQGMETIIVAWIVAIGVALADAQTGLGLVWYLAAYAVARFVLEQFRGDELRHRPGGLTPAQLTGLAITAVTLAATAVGVLPAAPIPAAALTAMIASSPLLARRAVVPDLTDARHCEHFAQALRQCLPPPSDGHVRSATTRCGAIVSAARAHGSLTIGISPVGGEHRRTETMLRNVALMAGTGRTRGAARRGQLLVIHLDGDRDLGEPLARPRSLPVPSVITIGTG